MKQLRVEITIFLIMLSAPLFIGAGFFDDLGKSLEKGAKAVGKEFEKGFEHQQRTVKDTAREVVKITPALGKDVEKEEKILARMSDQRGIFTDYPPRKPKNAIRLITYNIQRAPGGFAGSFTKLADKGRWYYQKRMIKDLLVQFKPDVMGTQELSILEQKDLGKYIPGYSWFGEGAGPGVGAEVNTIMFNIKTVKLLKSGTFWLNPTKERYARGWDSAYPRIATWGFFEHLKTGKKFYVYNTHLDNKSGLARQKGARLILDEMIKNPEVHAFFMGDLNSYSNAPWIKSVMQSPLYGEARSAAKKVYAKYDGTVLSWKQDIQFGQKGESIDWIFFNLPKKTTILNYAIIIRDDKKIASDHLPVMADVVLK